MRSSISSILFVCSLVTMGGLLAGADKNDGIWANLVTPRDGEERIGEIVLEAEILAV